MKKWFTILSMVSSLSTVSSSAFADSVVCQDSVNLVLQSKGIFNSPGVEAIAPNHEPMRVFEDSTKQVTVNASAGTNEWSWIIVTQRDSGKKTQDLQLSYSNCKLSTIVSNQRQSDGSLISQVSASAQFCINLNAGLKPTVLDEIYLEFSDGSGNISANEIEEVKTMCKAATVYLK